MVCKPVLQFSVQFFSNPFKICYLQTLYNTGTITKGHDLKPNNCFPQAFGEITNLAHGLYCPSHLAPFCSQTLIFHHSDQHSMPPSQCFLYCLWLITIHLPHLLVLGIPKINLIIPLGPSSSISKFLSPGSPGPQIRIVYNAIHFIVFLFFMTTVTLIITCLLSAILIQLHTYGRLGPFSFVCSQSCSNKEPNLLYRRK